MKKSECPKCKSTNYLRERKLDGDTTCSGCGYKAKSTEWDKSSPAFTAFREMLDGVAHQSFLKTIEKQEGHTPKDFIDMIKKSDYFKGLYSEAFIAGLHFSKQLNKEDLIFVYGDSNEKERNI